MTLNSPENEMNLFQTSLCTLVMKIKFLVAKVFVFFVLLSSRLQRWWRRRPEDTDPPRTTWATCPHPTSLLLRWQTPQTSETFTASASVTEITEFLLSFHPLDRNHEERIWAVGGTPAHGTPEHEEVNPTQCNCSYFSQKLGFFLICLKESYTCIEL